MSGEGMYLVEGDQLLSRPQMYASYIKSRVYTPLVKYLHLPIFHYPFSPVDMEKPAKSYSCSDKHR